VEEDSVKFGRHSREVRFVAAAILSLLIAAAAGCGKKTVGPEPGDPGLFHYLAPTSPQNVLQNLIFAYAKRDSVETAAVYDSTYQGTTTDLSSPTPVLTFTKADEVRHVGRLKLDINLVSVFVDLGSPSTWQRLPAYVSDPPDWAIITIANETVRIEDIARATTWNISNNTMEYKFKPTVAAPGDTTWTIVQWSEFG